MGCQEHRFEVRNYSMKCTGRTRVSISYDNFTGVNINPSLFYRCRLQVDEIPEYEGIQAQLQATAGILGLSTKRLFRAAPPLWSEGQLQ